MKISPNRQERRRHEKLAKKQQNIRNMTINDVVVVGGGSSGWLSALYLRKICGHLNVTVIESDKIPHIGVGESTQPQLSRFLYNMGYAPTDWMPHANATYKLGVMFNGWSDNQFIIDAGSKLWSSLDTTEYDSYSMHDAAIATNMSPKEWSEWFPPYRMAKNNVSPKLGKERFNFSGGDIDLNINAVHWDNHEIIKWLKSECIKMGITHIVDNVTNANLDEEGYIKELVLEKRSTNVSGDLYLDCSGFHSVILNDVYNRPWESVEHILPLNNGVIIRKKYANPQKECHPYTGATAMDSGWMWTVPIYSDLSYGYVYSDKYIDKDDAEKELRTKINDWDTSALHVPFHAGQRDRIAFKNVYAVGLSAGFLEPLEATNLAFTVNAIESLVGLLYETGFVYNDEDMGNHLSKMFSSMVDEIVDFIYMHYKMATKNDTLFWKDMEEIPVPEQVLPMYNAVKNSPLSRQEFFDIMMKDKPHLKTSPPISVFGAHHWWQLLKGCGRYENYTKTYSDDFIKYSKMVLGNYSHRIDSVLDIYPNHYDYLTKWYENQ